MEPGTDGAPLNFKSELPITRDLRVWSLGPWGAREFSIRTSYHPRTPRMEPWTDGAPLIFNQNFLSPGNSEEGALDWGAPDFKIRTSSRP